MINLTNEVFKNDTFKTAFMKLFQAEMNHKAYYSVKRIMDNFQKRGPEVEATDAELRKKYLKEVESLGPADENGVQKPIKKFEWTDKDAANEEFKKLYTAPFDIEVSKLWAVDVAHLKFTPAEWSALEPVIADIDNLART